MRPGKKVIDQMGGAGLEIKSRSTLFISETMLSSPYSLFSLEIPRAALEKADVLLNMKHGIVRLDNIWGAASTLRPVKFLIKKIQLLLKEYLSSGDIEEATRCLKVFIVHGC